MIPDRTQTVIDQMGRTVVVPRQPRRIISLVPSQTELLFDLGLDVEIVGRIKCRVGYFIWQKPFMVVGGRTFIHDMLTRCGLVNAFAAVGDGRYPELTAEQIGAADLDAILLSSEPFPFAEKHRQAFQAQYAGTARSRFGFAVYLVDGEMFSWYGSRLLLAADYLRQFTAALDT